MILSKNYKKHKYYKLLKFEHWKFLVACDLLLYNIIDINAYGI